MSRCIKKILTRNVNQDNFVVSQIIPKNFFLNDKVIIYFKDSEWKVIKFEDMIKICILYDRDSTLILNPITLITCVIDGHAKVMRIDKHNGQMTIKVGDLEFILEKNDHPKKEAQIMTLRDVFIFKSDPKYITITTSLTEIIGTRYYSNYLDQNNMIIPHVNTFHPKTLVYIIQYTSYSGKRKSTIIVGKDACSKKITGYDYKKSDFNDYFKTFSEKLEKMDTFIFPLLWYSANLLFSGSKIVKL